jgi:hypothetical protein
VVGGCFAAVLGFKIFQTRDGTGKILRASFFKFLIFFNFPFLTNFLHAGLWIYRNDRFYHSSLNDQDAEKCDFVVFCDCYLHTLIIHHPLCFCHIMEVFTYSTVVYLYTMTNEVQTCNTTLIRYALLLCKIILAGHSQPQRRNFDKFKLSSQC